MADHVGAIMTRAVVTAAPDDTAARIARLLIEHAISAVPVCDAEGKLLGIVSEGDLLRPFGQQHALRREWWLGLLAEGANLAPDFLDYVRHDHHTARDLMSAPVRTVREDTSLAEAADLLARHGIKRLPVLRDRQVVGIVSRADLLRAFLGGVPPRSAERGIASIGATEH